MREKAPISKLIKSLGDVGLYDKFTQARLDILASTFEGAEVIAQKERVYVEHLFSEFLEGMERLKEIKLISLAGADKEKLKGRVKCEVTQFLGWGNAGPVFAVEVDKRPYALKLYAAAELREVIETHGAFGLGGLLQELDQRSEHSLMLCLGRDVLARKAKGIYARSKKIVKIYSIGIMEAFNFVLMELLGVEPISKVDVASLKGDVAGLACLAMDCAAGLCQLHVEERRLHLNIRPEAFIKQDVKPGNRLPKYTFFHYPKEFQRPEESLASSTEFVMVDHLDNSIAVTDRGPKGLATVGSWLYLPPENLLELLKILRDDYETHVVHGHPVEQAKTIKLKRTQMDDIWALGVTLYEFLSGGRSPFGAPKNLAEMVNSILLTKFDFGPIPGPFRKLLASMLDKDPKRRFTRTLEDCPREIASRKVVAEAVLYKLELIALEAETIPV